MSDPIDQTPADETVVEETSADPEADALRAAVREIEEYAAQSGWDQAARLFALVPTADLRAREPGLAESLGVDPATAADSLTPVEQEQVTGEEGLESVLARIMWPAEVLGCAAVVERLVLPPSVDDELPDDPAAAQEFAAGHPDRQEVRIVAAAVRSGATYCAMRLRSHDDAFSVLESRDLAPSLLQLLLGTLEQ